MNTIFQAVVFALITQLNHDDFVAREKAHQALTQMMPGAIGQLHIAERSKHCEVRQRAKLILDGHYGRLAERFIAEHKTESMPWIDLAIFPSAFDGYLQQARNEIGMGQPMTWLDYREATRMMVADMIRGRRSHSEVSELLRRLRHEEREWIRQNGHVYKVYGVMPPDVEEAQEP